MIATDRNAEKDKFTFIAYYRIHFNLFFERLFIKNNENLCEIVKIIYKPAISSVNLCFSDKDIICVIYICMIVQAYIIFCCIICLFDVKNVRQNSCKYHGLQQNFIQDSVFINILHFIMINLIEL